MLWLLASGENLQMDVYSAVIGAGIMKILFLRGGQCDDVIQIIVCREKYPVSPGASLVAPSLPAEITETIPASPALSMAL